MIPATVPGGTAIVGISVGSGVAADTEVAVGKGVSVAVAGVVGAIVGVTGVGVGWGVCAGEQAANKLRSRQQRMTEKYRRLWNRTMQNLPSLAFSSLFFARNAPSI